MECHSQEFSVLCFLVPCDWACFLCFIPMLDCVCAGSTAGFQYERFVRARAMGVPSVFSFCSPMDHRPNLLCWDKRLYKRINEFIEINLYLF